MHMGRKSAVVLLAIVVLWAAMPALACLAPTGRAACCQSMAMQDCGSPAVMHCSSCCRIQPADTPLIPGSASISDHMAGLAQCAVPAALVPLPVAGNGILRTAAIPPLPGSPGNGSVLRI